MKINWQTKKLGEVCDLQNGFAFKSSEYVNSGFFVMRIANVQDGFISSVDPKYILKAKNKFQQFILNEGDILISLTGNVGRVGILKQEHLPAVLNQRVARIKPDEKELDRLYLFYFLRSPIFLAEVINKGHGMAQKNVSTEDIKRLEIPVPGIKEQRGIVKRIEELFAKIDEAQKLREESKKSASALLQSALNEIFSSPKSKNWEEKKLGNICEKTKLVQPREISKDDFSYIDITSVGDAVGADVVRAKVMPVKNAPSRARKLVKEGDTIFATTRPYLKRIAFISKQLNKSIASTGFCVLRPKPEIVDPSYIFHIVSSDDFVSKIILLQRGASYPAVSDKDILNQKISLPPLAEQKKIVAYLDSFSEKVRKLQDLQQKTADDFKNLKKSILAKAFKGEL